MLQLRGFASLFQRQRGASIVEFAFVAPVLSMMLFAMLEYGRAFAGASTLEGATLEAARVAAAGTGLCPSAKLEAARTAITTAMSQYPPAVTPTVTVQSYSSFRNVGRNEPFTDSNNNGTFNAGEPYTDVNGNGRWDADQGASGIGQADQVVWYQVTYEFNTLFGFFDFSFPGGRVRLTAETVVRNEPHPNIVGCT
jgi:Flp pilus assembly protein TadG